jgi:hypothetical protein
MNQPQEIDLRQLKFRRELTDRLEDVIRNSAGSMIAVCPEFNPLFPGFLWEERGILFKAELIRPTYRITQMNKPTEGDNNEAG